MSNARRLNDGMGEYVAHQVIKLMNKKGIMVKDSRILILGITFKENCPDIRNTKVVDIYATLKEYTANITIYDPFANKEDIKKEYGIDIQNDKPDELKGKFDTVILAVGHNEFKELSLRSYLTPSGVLYDVKGILDKGIIDGRL
jgi:UDP-N-acetyl-D-galactosamine dehydrogenase